MSSIAVGTRHYPIPRPVPDGHYLGPDAGVVEVVDTFWTYADSEDREWAKDNEEQWVRVRYYDGAEYTIKAVCLYPVPESKTDDAAKALLKRLIRYQTVAHAVTGQLVACEEHPSGLLLRASTPRQWWADVPWFVEYLLVSQDEQLLQKTRRWARNLIRLGIENGNESTAA